MSRSNALVACLVSLSALGLASAVSAEQDADAFFADVRAAYAARSSYGDLGEIEITEEFSGVEDSQVHFFETSATRGAGLVWRAMMASDRGFDDRAVWLSGDAVMIYDSSLRQAKAAESMAAALEDVLGPTAGQAVIVPRLLNSQSDSSALDALASAGGISPPEPCFGDRECRSVSATLEDGATIRITVESGTLWVHDVELVVPREDGTMKVRVRHSENSFADESTAQRSAFTPPPTTREVSEWDVEAESAFDPAVSQAGFYDTVTVDLITVSARIVDGTGRRIANVGPTDLLATIGGKEFPISAVDWQGVEPASDPTRSGEGDTTLAFQPTPLEGEHGVEGRLIVVFLQNDFEPTRVKGHMKLFPGLLHLIDNLQPADRVAVLSFYAHLKLWQDFTTDRAAIKASLERAFFPGATPGPVKASEPPSILDVFDFQEARDVAHSAEAVRYTADALAPLPGEKDIIFFGYGLEGEHLPPMLRALQSARATTLIIDTTQATGHTLGATLTSMAASTGGTYNSSFVFADQALHRIERLLEGHYVITIDRSADPNVTGTLALKLQDRSGRILMTPSAIN